MASRTGVAASTSSSPAASTAASVSQGAGTNANVPQKPPRILACVLCQHRKIKCDRNFPCANCVKANVTCTPSTPAPARKRRRPNQDLQERLARCEELLKEYASAKPPSPSPANSPEPKRAKLERPPEFTDPAAKWKPAGQLIEEDGGLRFMESRVLGTVYDELRSMRKLVDEEIQCDDATPAPLDEYSNSPDDNSELIFGAETPSTNPEDLTPSPSHIVRLWQIYLDRCNPLTKVIHVPTIQPYLLEATGTSPNLPKNVEALLFSIYTLAVVSMTKDECEEVLGIPREKALAKFSAGLRSCMIRLGFLKTHDLFTLQALVIYLISLQGRYNRHASWILNGVVIRIAQKMGLHRDGELLGLKPFETEMRRRLWWQIIMLDSKYAILSGLSHTLLPRGWDTKEPKNISDADLLPSATEPIQDQEGPTDMILVLAVFKIAKNLIQAPDIEAILILDELECKTAPQSEKIEQYRNVVRRLQEDFEELFERYSSPTAGDLHKLARQIGDHIMSKLCPLIKASAEGREQNGEVSDQSSNTFRVAVDSTSHAVEQHKIANYPAWDWFHRLHFQLDIFAYLVGQLTHRTEGRLVDHAWEIVENVYKYYPEFYDISQRVYHQLAYFLFKAWRRREEVLRKRLGHAPEVPYCVQKLRALMPGPDDSSVKSETGKTPNNEMFNFVTGGASRYNGNGDRGALHYNGTDSSQFDIYMGNYFDLEALEFDLWGGNHPQMVPNMPVPHSAAQAAAMQVQNAFPYGMGPPSEW
ncbi:C6 zinc finger domain-containing protein [Diaporthe amygdali]|uniref:C6 zinc finger domain-containing protein n=1 Tax=Phomopsis amygdali TaxID=1214568 RepID=UPI0022FDC192|nr:C6 zinc finger domain-containing protein [Diaporthe amygdali]KAJ0117153.1 C6 zinc finger domain-containing protein [Diaporthe amygdali]